MPPFATPLYKVWEVGRIMWGGPNLANLGNTHVLLNGKFPRGTCLDYNRSSQSSGICFQPLSIGFCSANGAVFSVWCWSSWSFNIPLPGHQATRGHLTVILALGWGIWILSGWDGEFKSEVSSLMCRINMFTIKSGIWVGHLGKAFEHNVGPNLGGRNLNKPICKSLNA